MTYREVFFRGKRAKAGVPPEAKETTQTGDATAEEDPLRDDKQQSNDNDKSEGNPPFAVKAAKDGPPGEGYATRPLGQTATRKGK
jgi:hypothetical protein